MTLRVEKGPRRGTVALICAGTTNGVTPRIRLSRNVAAGDGRYFTGSEWGNTPVSMSPMGIVEADGETRLVLGSDVVNVIEAATRVHVEIPELGIDEDVLWPELDILPGTVIHRGGALFQGDRPLRSGDVEITPAAVQLPRADDGRLLAQTFTVTSHGGSGRVRIVTGDERLSVRPPVVELRPERSAIVTVEWTTQAEEPETPVTVSFDVAGGAVERRVNFAPRATPAPSPPPSPTRMEPAPTSPDTGRPYDLRPEDAIHIRRGPFAIAPQDGVFILDGHDRPLSVSIAVANDTVSLDGPAVRTVAPRAQETFRFRSHSAEPRVVELRFEISGHAEVRRIVFEPMVRRRWWIIAAATAALLLALAAVAFFYTDLFRRAPPEPTSPVTPVVQEQPLTPATPPVAQQPVLLDLLRDRNRCSRAAQLIEMADQETTRTGGNRDLAHDAVVAAAGCGYAEADFRIAQGFDPSRIGEIGAGEGRPVPESALEHYAQAARSGHTAAAEALTRLCTWLRTRNDDPSEALESAVGRHCRR